MQRKSRYDYWNNSIIFIRQTAEPYHDTRLSPKLGEVLRTGLGKPLSVRRSSFARTADTDRLNGGLPPPPTPSSTSCPKSTSSSLSTGVPKLLPFALPALEAPPGPDADRLALLAWNVRLAVAFENKGSRYRSSNVWNHFPSSPIATPSLLGLGGWPVGSCAVGAIGSTSPSESYESDDAAEKTALSLAVVGDLGPGIDGCRCSEWMNW